MKRFFKLLSLCCLVAVGLCASKAGAAPVITSAPQSTSVVVGAPATLSVTATGSGTLTYQWRRAGEVTSLAGKGLDADGVGTAASFNGLRNVAVDGSGNVYVADTLNNKIRKIRSDGVVSTLAGSGVSGYADGTGTEASFITPYAVAVDRSGNVYVADTFDNRIRKITSAGVVTTLAGSGLHGSADGKGTAASFGTPYAVAVDGVGNVYVADSDNSKIRKITSAGVVTTLAGSEFGFADGSGKAAKFGFPTGVAVDANGNVYVADRNNNKIRKITSVGVVTTLAGSGDYGSANGTGVAASFANPDGVAVDGSGNVYVAESQNKKIRKISVAAVVSTLAGSGTAGSEDGTGSAASFSNPTGVAVDGNGTVYVADSANRSVRQITSAGVVSGFAGFGRPRSVDGTGMAASFVNPTGVAVDGNGTAYVVDGNVIRKVTSDGVVSTLAGSAESGFADGKGTAASFSSPGGVAVDGNGNVYVADHGNYRIRKITSAGDVTTIAGSGGFRFSDGNGVAASFIGPSGVAVDGSGNVYVTDSGVSGARVRKVTSTGLVTTLAGSAVAGAADGTGVTATFDNPTGLAVDGSGNVYVADSNNQKIRKITSAGVVTTLAGSASGTRGSTDGIGAAASFTYPLGVAVDGNGNVYVAEAGNQKIRKITSGGVVSTLAGTFEEGSADGAGASASFRSPTGVAVDGNGNVYVADAGNYKIRKITSGTNISGATSATYTIPASSVADAGGYECVVSDGAGTVSSGMVTVSVSVPPVVELWAQSLSVAAGTPVTLNVGATGTGPFTYQWRKEGGVTTFAGSEVRGDADGTAVTATFDNPYGVAVDGSGNVYVADLNNSKVRKITSAGVVSTLAGSGQYIEADGIGVAASFIRPAHAAVDGSGNVYVTELDCNTIRKITSSGVVTTLAGSRESGFADRVGAAALFDHPAGIAVDGSGNVYVADSGNYAIRKITSAGVVSTLAGSGVSGSTDGIGAAASFNGPSAVAVDGNGNVYVADSNNNKIRKITSTGVVTTLAGSGEHESVDGVGGAASITVPYEVALDGNGNVLVLSNQRIRKITSSGVVTTVADLVGLSECRGLTVDRDGYVYLAEVPSNRIRKITLGTNIQGATSARYTIAAPKVGDAGNYACVVTGPGGTVSSGTFTVSVTPVPARTQEIVFSPMINRLPSAAPFGVSATSTSGLPVTVKVVSGPADISENLVTLKGTTGVVTLEASQLGDDNYKAAAPVTRAFNVVESLDGVPVISKQPVGGSALPGGTVKLSAVATGKGTLTYQWRKNGVAITGVGATSKDYSFVPATSEDSGLYDCVITSAGGSVTSNPVQVLISSADAFSALAGSYSGLVKASSSEPSPNGTVKGVNTEGQFVAAVLKTGAFSGKLTIDGLVLPVDGTFDSTGAAHFKPALGKVLSIARPGKSPLELTLNLSSTTGKLTGTLTQRIRSSVGAVSEVEADRAYYNGTNLVVPDEYLSVTGNTKGDGVYTVVFAPAAGDGDSSERRGTDYPAGEGFATAKLSKAGVLSIVGTLADGTPFTSATTLSQENRGGVFVPLYKGGGFVSGWVVLDSTKADSDFSADGMLWCRSYMDVQHYPYGWPEGLQLDMAGAKYAAVSGQSVLPGVTATTSNLIGNVSLRMSGGPLGPEDGEASTGEVRKTVNLSAADVVTKVEGKDASFTLAVTRGTGLWSGTFTDSNGAKSACQGVVYQKGTLEGGHGFFLSATPAVKNYGGQGGLAKLEPKEAEHSSGTFQVSGNFSESYTEALKTTVMPDDGGTTYDTVPNGTTSFTVVGTFPQGTLPVADASTSVGVTVGGYSHSGSLADATSLSISGHRAVYDLKGPDPTDVNGERQISIGSVTYVWTTTSVSVTGSLKLAAGSVAAQEASSSPGAVASEVNATVSFGGIEGSRKVHVTGTATSTVKVVGSGEVAEEKTLASATLRGVTDYINPVCGIGAPGNAARILQSAGESLTVSGTASDDMQLREVSVRVNGKEWTPAELVFGQVGKTTDGEPVLSINKGTWSAPVTLMAGTNLIEVKAVDGDGNESGIVKRSLQYVVTGTLQVSAAEQGSVSTGFGGSSNREVGVSYTVTATPKAGFVFGGWKFEGGDMGAAGLNEVDLARPSLKFTFVEGISLTPEFVANPFVAVAGNYNGLVKASHSLPEGRGTDSDLSTEGYLSVMVTNTGAFSGKLSIDGSVLSVAGEFDSTGVARFGANRAENQVVARVGKSGLVVALNLDLSASSGGSGKLRGTVSQYMRSNIVAVSDVNADRAFYNGSTVVVPDEYLTVTGTARADGAFTALWTPQSQQEGDLRSSAYPQGKGVATLKVSKTGIVSLAGVLADGASVSASAPLSKAKTWPLFAQLYGKLGFGFLRGEVALDSTASESDMSSSDMLWVRSYMDVQHYPYGWEDGLKLDFIGAKYVVSTSQSVLPGLGTADADGNAVLRLSGEASGMQEKALNLSVTDVVSRLVATDTSYTVAFTRATGSFSGSVTQNSGGKATFQGVIYQKGSQTGGYGFFLTPVPEVKDYTGEGGVMSLLVR
ncbi:MAG: hypothetical protein WCO60_17350 [Verrucomicrobiota bacterium]